MFDVDFRLHAQIIDLFCYISIEYIYSSDLFVDI